MANPWDASTAYSFGAVVSYNGIDYFRSQYPATATMGTPPNVELSVDPKGDPIRTWTFASTTPAIGGFPRQPTFHTCYFRLIAPDYNTTQLAPLYQYAGGTDYQINAYGSLVDPTSDVEDMGYAIEYDQFQESPPAPAAQADKCGVAFQQYQECSTGEFPAPFRIDQGADISVGSATITPGEPRTYSSFVQFNHPLYFRRTITCMTRIIKQVTSSSGTVITYENNDYTVTPTDTNYVSNLSNNTWYTAANASFTFTVPENTYGPGPDDSTTYALLYVIIKDVTEND